MFDDGLHFFSSNYELIGKQFGIADVIFILLGIKLVIRIDLFKVAENILIDLDIPFLGIINTPRPSFLLFEMFELQDIDHIHQ